MNMRSLYFRLILWYSGLAIAVSLAFGAYTYHGVKERLSREMEQTFTRRSLHIAENVVAQTQDKTKITSQINAVYSPEANNRFIRVLQDDGSVLYMSGAPNDNSFIPGQIPLPANLSKGLHTESLSSGVNMLIVTTPAHVAGKNIFIEMGMPSSELDTTLHGLVATLLLGLPVVALVVSAGGYFLVRHSLNPVEQIRATAERITFGNLSSRLPVIASGDALEHLSVTLNQMLARLEDAYQQVSRFSADASHELRTPLTIMRGELESLIVQKDWKTEELRERVASVLEETEHLSHITENLFVMSRLDAGGAHVADIAINLTHLVETTADQMALLAEEKSITLIMQLKEFVWVKGDPARLKQVIVNLLDNAIKYTSSQGKIIITTAIADHKAVFSVSDNGIGIPAAALPHVFERFYRAEKARSREQGGAGLGLSIVHSICQAHGGSVSIESIEGKGTTCRVELPCLDGKEVKA